ncbi:hypothetical protein [Actinacidiphila glaucinigra]|uniref:hypothetical protein n=1 Tax=Actinacidiphila glaucinigra TaxID=235986 RepID=UPI003D92951A
MPVPGSVHAGPTAGRGVTGRRAAGGPARTSAPQLARLRLWQARALRASGRPGAAAEAPRLLRPARAVAEEYGMARPAAECAALLAETGGEE